MRTGGCSGSGSGGPGEWLGQSAAMSPNGESLDTQALWVYPCNGRSAELGPPRTLISRQTVNPVCSEEPLLGVSHGVAGGS